MKIGIIGVGMVGGAIRDVAVSKGVDVVCYDKFKAIGNETDVISADLIFVCVPTPTNKGEQDLSSLRDVLLNLATHDYKGVIVVKCTVLPGAIDKFSYLFPSLRLAHNPEFLTERNAANDFANQKAILVSTPSIVDDVVIRQAYDILVPEAMVMSYSEFKVTEGAKYLHNTFLATKVAFMNEFYEYCNTISVSYEMVAAAAQSQGVIGTSHMKVPGPDGQRGFGGACFPKDTEALYLDSTLVGATLGILGEAIISNAEMRKKMC